MPHNAIPFSHTYSQLDNAFFSAQKPNPVSTPKTFIRNEVLAKELGIDLTWFQSENATDVFAGNRVPDNANPIATTYAGHQFSHFNPQLGDGRAVLLGEVETANGARFDIQLKGSGQTEYSRGGDGRSPLGPVIREYIMSEAMAALGVPTSRSLFAVTTGDQVYRQTPEPGGVLCRVASSHIRVGTFQFFAARGMAEHVKSLADYVIARHYPDCKSAASPYQALYIAIAEKQAELIAKWQSIGFVHGVMNTDNMLICGETIDYGPCAFIDTYSPTARFSSIDQHNRYAFDQQPDILIWNLARLAESMILLFDDDRTQAINFAQETLQMCASHYETEYARLMCQKLGVEYNEKNTPLIFEFLSLLEQNTLDYTQAFRALSENESQDNAANSFFNESFSTWLSDWKHAKTATKTELLATNPVYIPRLHLIEAVIQQAYNENSFDKFYELLEACCSPYKRLDNKDWLAQAPLQTERVMQTFCGT